MMILHLLELYFKDCLGLGENDPRPRVLELYRLTLLGYCAPPPKYVFLPFSLRAAGVDVTGSNLSVSVALNKSI